MDIEKIIQNAVDKFLGWSLPKDFHPDGGIMFMDVYDNGTEEGGTFSPVGTNLFTAQQAELMFEYVLSDILTAQQTKYTAEMEALADDFIQMTYGNDSCSCFKHAKDIAIKHGIELTN